MSNTTLTVPGELRDRLRALAAVRGRTLAAELAVLVEAEERRRWETEVVAAYERVQGDFDTDHDEWHDFTRGVRTNLLERGEFD